MGELNAAAMAIGYFVMGAVALIFATALAVAGWAWLMEQIWLAGDRIRERRAKKREAAPNV
jgi:hypothetical protein